MAGAQRKDILEADLDALWNAITDYESYPDFLDGIQSVKIKERDGDEVLAEYVVDMFGKKITYTLKHTEKPKKRVEWEMVDGQFFKYNNGSWDLKEKTKGQVEATYTVDVGLPLLVPKSIVTVLTGSQLPTMMKAFGDRAKKSGKKAKKSK